MIFTVISKEAPMYGQGKQLGEDCFERVPGMSMFFYDGNSVENEFGPFGLLSQSLIDEPASGATLPFINVVCKKTRSSDGS